MPGATQTAHPQTNRRTRPAELMPSRRLESSLRLMDKVPHRTQNLLRELKLQFGNRHPRMTTYKQQKHPPQAEPSRRPPAMSATPSQASKRLHAAKRARARISHQAKQHVPRTEVLPPLTARLWLRKSTFTVMACPRTVSVP